MFNYKLSSEFVISENCTMQNKPQLIIMRDTTFSYHTSVSLCVLFVTENGLVGPVAQSV
jgi:hypothetical protein